jgi:branched-chain amino acid transport system substrate-binding protein
MNSTAIKEAVAVGYPREKMYGVWWSGAEQDVRPAESGAIGYNSAALQHTSGQFKLHDDLKKYLYDEGNGYAAKWDDTGEILYVPASSTPCSASKRSAQRRRSSARSR